MTELVHFGLTDGVATITLDSPHNRNALSRQLVTELFEALDRAARTITLTIPAACLGNPDWVKVGNGVFFHNRTRLYEDDARRDGAVTDEGWKYSPKLTPQ